MTTSPIDMLVGVGFSEREARAYITLLEKGPATCSDLASSSGIPRSAIRQVADQLAARGAVVVLPTGKATQYAPVPVAELLDRLHREHEELIDSLQHELGGFSATPDLNRIWTIEGHASIMARARAMIGQAKQQIHLVIWPGTFLVLRPALAGAIGQGVQVVVYTTGHVDLPGGRVVVTSVPESRLEHHKERGLILICDGQEALIGERLATRRAQAAWTRNSTFVSILGYHLRRGGRHRFL